MWTDEIELVKEIKGRNENGFVVITTESKRKVFANKKSVNRTEFYKSHEVGMKVDAIFELKVIDYCNEELIIFNNRRYKVIRQYKSINDENIQLTVTDITEER